ncbi:MAG: hypothetical protein IJ142_07470 [Bacteroidaceae bacterium]|nr:hypothetical protein [Bacteroidaceae bacterium]
MPRPYAPESKLSNDVRATHGSFGTQTATAEKTTLRSKTACGQEVKG